MTIRLEFKLEDLWIGAYWNREGYYINIWVCLVPCLPIHIRWWSPTEY